MAKIEQYKSDAERCRAFFCTTYPEHIENVRTQVFEPLDVDHGCWILHDKDLNDDGELKKPHFHIYMDFGSNSNNTIDQLARFLHVENIQFNDHIFNKPVQAVRKNQKACEDYMLHIGYPGFKYSPSEIKYFNCSAASSAKDIDSQIQRILDWCNDCKEQHIHYNYLQFYQECLNQGFGRMMINKSYWFDQIYKTTFGVDNYESRYRYSSKRLQVPDSNRDE